MKVPIRGKVRIRRTGVSGEMGIGRLAVLRDWARMVRRRKIWFLVPFLFLLILAMALLVVLESPVLIPFFYAIF